jgi:hypothetical protein
MMTCLSPQQRSTLKNRIHKNNLRTFGGFGLLYNQQETLKMIQILGISDLDLISSKLGGALGPAMHAAASGPDAPSHPKQTTVQVIVRLTVIFMAQLYSIVSADSADADQLARGRAFYTDVEFASQLCSEFAAAERCNLELSSCFSKANDTLRIIL